MNSFFKALKFAKEKPIGCSAASALSILMMAGVLAGGFWLFFAFIGAKVIKDSVESSTGFHIICENSFVNVFTGECTFNRITIYNPSAYNLDKSKTNPLSSNMMSFANIKKIKMQISPFKIFKNMFEFSSFSADIEKINCFRINQSDYNLEEFLSGIAKLVSVKTDNNGKKFLKYFALKIQHIEYVDVSSQQNLLRMKASKPLFFVEEDIADLKKFDTEIENAFSDCRASFISNTIKNITWK